MKVVLCFLLFLEVKASKLIELFWDQSEIENHKTIFGNIFLNLSYAIPEFHVEQELPGTGDVLSRISSSNQEVLVTTSYLI